MAWHLASVCGHKDGNQWGDHGLLSTAHMLCTARQAATSLTSVQSVVETEGVMGAVQVGVVCESAQGVSQEHNDDEHHDIVNKFI